METQTKTSNKLTLKKPYKILIDIWGVITSWDFVYYLNDYFDNNLVKYLTENWKKSYVKDIIQRLSVQSIEDKTTNSDLPLIASEEQNNIEVVIQSIVDNLKYRKNNELKTFDKSLQRLYDSVWTHGYESGQLMTHAFDDVIEALKMWTSRETQLDAIKVYTYASGAPLIQRLFLCSSVCGDLSQFITYYINSFHTYKSDSYKYKCVISSLLERNATNILYLTDRPKRARAATEAGMRSVIVLRPGNQQYLERDLYGFQTIHSLEDLEFVE